jgi:ERCC4-type nuclease
MSRSKKWCKGSIQYDDEEEGATGIEKFKNLFLCCHNRRDAKDSSILNRMYQTCLSSNTDSEEELTTVEDADSSISEKEHIGCCFANVGEQIAVEYKGRQLTTQRENTTPSETRDKLQPWLAFFCLQEQPDRDDTEDSLKRKRTLRHKKWSCLEVQSDSDSAEDRDSSEDSLLPNGSQTNDQSVGNSVNQVVSEPSQPVLVEPQIKGRLLVFGELLHNAVTSLKYTFNGKPSYSSKLPIIGMYTCSQFLNLQTKCARKIVIHQELDLELHEEQTLKVLEEELSPSGSKRIFVVATGWPITSSNLVTIPAYRDRDILMWLQLCVLLTLCNCLIINVSRIDREGWQALLQILASIARNRKTAIIFHHVKHKDDFRAQRELIEECLPLSKFSDEDLSTEEEVNWFPSASSADKIVPSTKMKLFHCVGEDDEAISHIHRISSQPLEDYNTLEERECEVTIQELFNKAIGKFAEHVRFSTEETTVDGNSQLLITI